MEAAILAQTRVHVVHKALALMERSDLPICPIVKSQCQGGLFFLPQEILSIPADRSDVWHTWSFPELAF